MTVTFTKAARGYVLSTELWLPRPVEEVFAFFADAHNLQRLTPPWLGFRILTPPPIAMREGTLIDYRISLWGVPMVWRTRIPAWEPPARFVDEQIAGPYALWVHEHTFRAADGGTVCADRVEYAHVGGAVGETVFVRPNLRRIFAFRARAMCEWAGAVDRNLFGNARQAPA